MKPPGHTRVRSWIPRTVLSALLAALLLGILLARVDVDGVLASIAEADPLLLAAAAAVSLLANALAASEALRWMLGGFSARVSFTHAFIATNGSKVLRVVLPAGFGEVARAVYLSRACGVDAGRSAAAIASLLWVKLAWLVMISIAGWLLLPDAVSWPGPVLLPALAVVLTAPVAAVLLGRRIGRSSARTGGWRGTVAALARSTRELGPSGLVLGSLHALVVVLAEMLVFGIVLRAAGVAVDPLRIAAFLPMAVVAAKLPVTLLGLGARELLVVLLMAGPADAPEVAGAAILFSAVAYVLPAVVGAALTGSAASRIMKGGAGADRG